MGAQARVESESPLLALQMSHVVTQSFLYVYGLGIALPVQISPDTGNNQDGLGLIIRTLFDYPF